MKNNLKASIGGRGVGRLLWLKAFDGALIESQYFDDAGSCFARSFVFTAADGVTNGKCELAVDVAESGTTVLLHGFDPKYRDHSRKTVEAIGCYVYG